VPNAREGVTKDGNASQHSKDLFNYRLYIVVEFDQMPDKDQQASIILWLAENWCDELRLVVDSGGKLAKSQRKTSNVV
jgi:hypothetical protein